MEPEFTDGRASADAFDAWAKGTTPLATETALFEFERVCSNLLERIRMALEINEIVGEVLDVPKCSTEPASLATQKLHPYKGCAVALSAE